MSRAAFMTRAQVRSLMLAPGTRFRTSETVVRDTLALRATSKLVVLRVLIGSR
jgi:hypothetical protein